MLDNPTHARVLIMNLNVCTHMLERAFKIKDSARLDSKECAKPFNRDTTKDEKQERQRNDFLQVLKLLVLTDPCRYSHNEL